MEFSVVDVAQWLADCLSEVRSSPYQCLIFVTAL